MVKSKARERIIALNDRMLLSFYRQTAEMETSAAKRQKAKAFLEKRGTGKWNAERLSAANDMIKEWVAAEVKRRNLIS